MMDAKTRDKAKRAAEIAGELYRLLDQLQKELPASRDFAGYLLVTDVKEAVFGRKSTEDVLGKLSAVATMGEK
jgi:hypothetical protein